MKDTLQPGIGDTSGVDVDATRTIEFMGEKARIYATPMLVRDIEVACRDLLGRHLSEGEDSVGTRIELDHLAATPLGMRVELSVRVVEVRGRAVTFAVGGRDPVEAICKATHTRFVVDIAKTYARLAAKADRVLA
jgi:predicted thioesterase